jgi:hypothetical protein
VPVEIRKLVVRMIVQPAAQDEEPPPPEEVEEERQRLVTECVEQVLRILEEQRER